MARGDIDHYYRIASREGAPASRGGVFAVFHSAKARNERAPKAGGDARGNSKGELLHVVDGAQPIAPPWLC